jgi:hypothetical protein
MAESPSNLAQAVQEVTEKAQLLVREEIELAKAEVQLKASKLVKGVAIGVAAGVFALGALLLILNGLAWLANDLLDSIFWGFFVVAGILLLFGALAGYLASKALKAGSPPAPQMAIEEAKLIKETVETHAHQQPRSGA